MGIFDKLFGKKSTNRPGSPVEAASGAPSTRAQPIEGPPEFVRAAEMQRAYWTHDAEEQRRLEARGVDQLGWRDLLRLHHLSCLQRLSGEPERGTAAEIGLQTAHRLLSSDSPYRPRMAMIWQAHAAQPGAGDEPSLTGDLLNASLSHLGCLEVYRLDATNQPSQIDFVSFDELSAVMFAAPSLMRAAKLFYEGGREEIVLVPLLYGLTWAIGDELDRAGRMTRFVAHLDSEALGAYGASGVGVGHQDLTIRGREGEGSLFGLGSVAKLSFPLDMSDPRFDERARGRGIDPDDLRRHVREG